MNDDFERISKKWVVTYPGVFLEELTKTRSG
jgi:hypothetical protein